MAVNDPYMLLSIVNTRLRDYYSNLDALCDDLSENKEEIIRRLNSIGYVYDEGLNCFTDK